MTFKLLALGVVAFIASLIGTAPAHLAANFLPSGVQAVGLQGTLLRGEARRLRVRGFNLGAVTWDLQPLYLLLGRVQSGVILEHPNLRGQGQVAVGLGGIRLIDTQLTSNTRLLAPYLSAYGVAVDGRFEADIESLRLSDAGPQAADGIIIWREARLESPAQLSLGDVNVTLSQDGDTAIADVKNTGNELRVMGEARLQQEWQYDARVKLEPTPDTPESVRDTLPLLGKPDARGAVTLAQQGTLTAVAAAIP